MKRTTHQQIPIAFLRSQVSPNSLNAEARTVDLIFSTGYKGKRMGWNGSYMESLDMSPEAINLEFMRNGAPLLANHQSWSLDSVIGRVENVKLESGNGIATVRFATDEKSNMIFRKVQDGILDQVSVGYRVDEYVDNTGPDDKIPHYRAAKWTPMEISIVPIGFDPGARVRSGTSNDGELFNRSFDAIVHTNEIADTSVGEINQGEKENKQMPDKNLTEEQRRLEIETAQKAAADKALAEYKEMQREVRSIVKDAGLEAQFAEDLFEKKDMNANEARKAVLAKLAEQKSQVSNVIDNIEIGKTETEKKREAACEAILHRVDRTQKISQGNPFQFFNLLRIMENVLGMHGRSPSEIVKRAMSTSDLPFILANVAEKAALAKYSIQPRTWDRWARPDTLRNYKTKNLVRSGDFSSLEQRQENGEFRRGSFGEEQEQVTLLDWGKIISFTRQMLINDDLDEISKVTAQTGVAASRLENRLVYEQLTSNPTMGDGVALFHATHANLATAGALTDTEIGEAFELMRNQTTVDGLDKLNLRPSFLICGPSNETTARKYLASISPTQASNVNVYSNSLELIVDSEISNDDYFFAANPDLIPTVSLFRLQGEESPRVESRTNFETESVDIKCAHAAVAKAVDFRGLVKNAGAT